MFAVKTRLPIGNELTVRNLIICRSNSGCGVVLNEIRTRRPRLAPALTFDNSISIHRPTPSKRTFRERLPKGGDGVLEK